MRTILVALALLAVASPALADLTGSDIRCVADTTLSFTTGLKQAGPRFVDFAADGNAAVRLVWFKRPGTGRDAGDIARSAIIYLRDYSGPRGFYFAAGPDSADVDIVTATEMVVTR